MPNFQLNYEPGAAEFAARLIGRSFSDEELAMAVGALDGSKLRVRIRKGAELAVEVENRKVLEQTRFLRRDVDGDLCVWNFRLEKAPSSYGVGLESLLRQVKGARAWESGGLSVGLPAIQKIRDTMATIAGRFMDMTRL